MESVLNRTDTYRDRYRQIFGDETGCPLLELVSRPGVWSVPCGNMNWYPAINLVRMLEITE